MKKLTLLLVTLLMLSSEAKATNPKLQPHTFEVVIPLEMYFSPKGGCTEAVIKELGKAKKLIRVQAYSFTSAPIAKALIDAHSRGVMVQVILDRSQRSQRNSSAATLDRAGISVVIDAKHAIAHNKIIIIDDRVVMTGSFNFTKNAEENNAENLLIIHDSSVAKRYNQNWEAHLAHSEIYAKKDPDAEKEESE